MVIVNIILDKFHYNTEIINEFWSYLPHVGEPASTQNFKSSKIFLCKLRVTAKIQNRST
jgi:hypothetical protein